MYYRCWIQVVRFELDARMRVALRARSAPSVGIDHDQHRYTVERVPDAVRTSLIGDLEN